MVEVGLVRGEGRPEAIAALGAVGFRQVVLREALRALGGEPEVRATEHGEGPSVRRLLAEILAGRAHRQVVEPVTVQVAGAEGGAEAVAVLGRVEADLGLCERLPGGRQPLRGPVHDIDRAGVPGAPDALPWHPDRHVGEAVAVEVAGAR